VPYGRTTGQARSRAGKGTRFNGSEKEPGAGIFRPGLKRKTVLTTAGSSGTRGHREVSQERNGVRLTGKMKKIGCREPRGGKIRLSRCQRRRMRERKGSNNPSALKKKTGKEGGCRGLVAERTIIMKQRGQRGGGGGDGQICREGDSYWRKKETLIIEGKGLKLRPPRESS